MEFLHADEEQFEFLDGELENISNNYDWLMRVSSIMATGEVTRNGMIEIKRFMKILEVVNSSLIYQDVL